MPADIGAEEFELLARIAHRYYIDGRTQEEVAREFGLSRPKVQRLLDRARWTGVVDIHVEAPPWLHLDLEAAVRERFGLAEVIVSPARPDPLLQREEVARAAARYLERRIRDGDVVAISHGRDAGEVPRFFRPRGRRDCTFVSAMGGSPRADAPTNPNEIGRALAERSGGRAVSLFAPASVESVEMRNQLLAQDAIADPLRQAARATMALVGIGGVDDDCTMVRSGCFSVAEIRRLRDLGAVGDVLGNYVDAAGLPVASPESARLIGLEMDDLRHIETVVAVVSEPEKPPAILGILRAGVVDTLILDERNAHAVLELASESERAATPPAARSGGRQKEVVPG